MATTTTTTTVNNDNDDDKRKGNNISRNSGNSTVHVRKLGKCGNADGWTKEDAAWPLDVFLNTPELL